MKKNMAGLILVLFAIALFMTGCEKKAQEKEEAQEASARQLVIQKQTQTEIAEKKDRRKKTRAAQAGTDRNGSDPAEAGTTDRV